MRDLIHFDAATLRATVGPRELSAKSRTELRGKASRAIYEVLHVGRSVERSAQSRWTADAELTALLEEATPHHEAPGSAMLLGMGSTTATVEVSGLRLRVPQNDVPSTVDIGEHFTMPLPAARPALSPGFHLVDSSRGFTHDRGPLLRVYFHLRSADDAPRTWHAVLNSLEALGIAYRAKVLSRRADYPRRDALVLYLKQDAAHAVRNLPRLPWLGEQTSAFARRVAPGVAVAWEPADPREGRTRLSFGQHRARALADGLADGGWAAVPAALAAAGIDPDALHRNRNSPALP
ncbi:T3SS effector HopA1 family protein [Allokutzneria sp. NRRL B-24872]|uniref:T3SS effector HopA1 family protein n=1 Tax=Allokutzneria sp. NRRL B-24872 TaxID=1137961 RepID=UPI000A3797DB|nr:T3SS effector HopA1 family protein [Allokutzneria sp. NRRL B-24872]